MCHVLSDEVEIIPAESESSKHQGAHFSATTKKRPHFGRCRSEAIREVVEEVVVVVLEEEASAEEVI